MRIDRIWFMGRAMKCVICKQAMRIAERIKERRAFGPFGWSYLFRWICDSCERQKLERVTKAKFK